MSLLLETMALVLVVLIIVLVTFSSYDSVRGPVEGRMKFPHDDILIRGGTTSPV